MNIEVGFTAEEAIALAELAVVSAKAVFENEANLHAVAEIFRALKTETGAGVLTRVLGELVSGVRVADLLVLIVEAKVDNTVDGHVSGESRAGKSAENSHGSKSLLHFDILYWEKVVGRRAGIHASCGRRKIRRAGVSVQVRNPLIEESPPYHEA